jgi:hypothetical protein
MDKIKIFEYIIYKLLEWYRSNNPNMRINNFGNIKVMKLLFFVVSGKLKHTSDYKLLNIFNNWDALPLGPTENDIIYAIVNNKLNYYVIDDKETEYKDFVNIADLTDLIDISIRNEIDESICYIREKSKYNDLVNLGPFDLVDLSHTWHCWKKPFSIAKENGRLREKIDIDLIRKEDKNYLLR